MSIFQGRIQEFLKGGELFVVFNSITGKIIAEKSNYRGVATPITLPLNPPLFFIPAR